MKPVKIWYCFAVVQASLEELILSQVEDSSRQEPRLPQVNTLKLAVRSAFILTLWTPEAGIPAARYINATARRRYTGGTVINATS